MISRFILFFFFSSYLLAFIQSIESFILLRIISMSRKNNRRLCYTHEKRTFYRRKSFQRVDKPSQSLSVLRAGAHECEIRSAPLLVLPRLQRFSITLKRRKRAKIMYILALFASSIVLLALLIHAVHLSRQLLC